MLIYWRLTPTKRAGFGEYLRLSVDQEPPATKARDVFIRDPPYMLWVDLQGCLMELKVIVITCYYQVRPQLCFFSLSEHQKL